MRKGGMQAIECLSRGKEESVWGNPDHRDRRDEQDTSSWQHIHGLTNTWLAPQLHQVLPYTPSPPPHTHTSSSKVIHLAPAHQVSTM